MTADADPDRLARRLERERARRLEAERIAEEATSRLFATNAQLDTLNDELKAIIYTVSHDLKNPMLTLLGYLDIWVEDRVPLDEEHAEDLRAMRRSARYMRSLIDDLLTVSRIGREREPERVRVHLTGVVSEIAEQLAHEHRDAHVEVAALPDVLGDELRLRQLFDNLLRNAMMHGGREDVTVRVTAEVHGGQLTVDVADDGVGLPAQHREAVFRMFHRGDMARSADSTGIGLAICRKVVQQMGGTLSAAPSDGGATFRILLPGDVVLGG